MLLRDFCSLATQSPGRDHSRRPAVEQNRKKHLLTARLTGKTLQKRKFNKFQSILSGNVLLKFIKLPRAQFRFVFFCFLCRIGPHRQIFVLPAQKSRNKMEFLSTLVFSSGNTFLALLLILLIYMTRTHTPTVDSIAVSVFLELY